jgi:deazaflavin-dependent oxidoreductase (nitroreductase family)
MLNILVKAFTKSNSFLVQFTHGRLGSRMGKQSVLLLHTIGRKSGKAYITPLSYYRDGDRYLIVASNWGKEDPPDWYRNLIQHPHTSIQVKNTVLQVEVCQAEGQEYHQLWQVVTSHNSQYLEYQKNMTRRLPIMILIPETQS